MYMPGHGAVLGLTSRVTAAVRKARDTPKGPLRPRQALPLEM